MKKTVLTTLTLLLLIVSSLPAQNDGANEAYIKAITTNSPTERAKLLKEYLATYGGKGTQYENFANANLCVTPYPGKTDQEAINYGEKSLALGGLDDITKYNVCVTVSAVYSKNGQNLTKAKNYAQQGIQIAKANKGKGTGGLTPAQWDKLIGTAYLYHGQANEKSKDLKGAVNSYMNAYNILKDKQVANRLAKTGKSLYDSKSYNEAEKALKIAAAALQDFGSIALYAKTLHRNGKKDEALKFYKQAYTKRKSGEIAYNIGVILLAKAKSNSTLADETLKYLFDASFLSAANSEKAMKLAESFFFETNKDLKFNEKVQELTEKSKRVDDLVNSFNKKFGDKTEEDLSDAEKKEMETIQAEIEKENKAIEKLKVDQEAALAQFQKLIEQAKQRLGIK